MVKANSKNVSILFYSTALCKLGPPKQFAKKWKINDFWWKKYGKGPKFNHSILGKEGEKKYTTFAMWSTQLTYE